MDVLFDDGQVLKVKDTTIDVIPLLANCRDDIDDEVASMPLPNQDYDIVKKCIDMIETFYYDFKEDWNNNNFPELVLKYNSNMSVINAYIDQHISRNEILKVAAVFDYFCLEICFVWILSKLADVIHTDANYCPHKVARMLNISLTP